jgi:hypothetical protein
MELTRGRKRAGLTQRELAGNLAEEAGYFEANKDYDALMVT